MDRELLAGIRSFNRVVTERIGLLESGYLGRDRPLGASRLLWEIDATGSTIRDLRSRLGLDSGYVSRLLSSLTAEGLVRVAPGRNDRRVRVVSLTTRGRRERAELDRLSDELARSMLEPLNPKHRAELAAAAATVERLLAATLITIAPVDPRADDARWCIEQYFTELARRFDGGFDPALAIPTHDEELTPPRGLLLVARLRGRPVGCGALKLHVDAPAEVKRMWVDRSVRGVGLGRRLLGELERRAAAAGADAVRLETNRALGEAIHLYRSAGYTEVAAFNDERYGDHWFEKRL